MITGENPQSLAINLRHLRALTAVAARGSVAAAAEGLFRVSSAITRSIADLEAALGRQLFDRRPGGLVLNDYGRLVLVRAERIEQEFKTAREQLAACGGDKATVEVRSLFASILNGRRLALVASLAERGSMAAVAREFGVTQPGISAAVRNLEDGLGLRLFDRSTRGLTATVAGDIVAFYFRRVLAELRHVVADIAASEGALEGTVHVGALPLGRTHVLPQAIAGLLARHPGLHVVTDESPYDALVAGLRNGELDFILGALRGGADAQGLDQEALFEDRLSLIARAAHPLAGVSGIDFEALHRASWVLSRQGAPSRDLLDRYFESAGEPPPRPAVETGDLGILRGLLLESDMLTAISARQLRYEIESSCLVVLDLPLDQTRRQIGLCTRTGAFPSPGARGLMDEIRVVSASARLQP